MSFLREVLSRPGRSIARQERRAPDWNDHMTGWALVAILLMIIIVVIHGV
jgi:hypothetical protein